MLTHATTGRSRRRLAAAAAVAAAAVAALAAPAPALAAPDTLDRYVLPGEQAFPEGIDVRSGSYYVTSTTTGAVYRGDLDQPRASVFLPGGRDGRTTAVGIEATADRLVVAGGSSGQVFVHNRRSGALVARFSNGGGTTFVNDVAVTPSGDAYLTDSQRPVLYRIPAAALRTARPDVVQPLPVWRDLTGSAIRYTDGFNLNGIVASDDGRFLVVVQSNTGVLYRVKIADRTINRISVPGASFTAGDGMVLLNSGTLYVLCNRLERIVEVRLDPYLLSGRVVGSTTDPRFQTPTTAAVAGDRLLVVNSQFAGPGAPPFTVSSVPLP